MSWRAPVLLLCLLLVASSASAAELVVTPQQVRDGEPFLLQVHLPGVTFAAVRWNDRAEIFDLQDDGGRLLLPVRRSQPAGLYPLRVYVVDRAGNTLRFTHELKVVEAKRPVERLSLPPGMVNPRKPEVLERIAREGRQLQGFYRLRTPSRFWTGVRRPVSDPVGSVFGLGRILNGQRKSPHSGVDFRSSRGTPVASPAAGTVVLNADLFYTGRTLVIDHGGGLISVLAHLQSARAATGDQVTGGEVVGTVGSSGRSTGPHLHWTVRLAGLRIDPLALIDLLSG